jgi:adenylate kinase family enzyme
MIIFINGSINSGKSTVSKLLSKKIGNCAVLEIDELRNFIEWMPLEQSIPLNWENAFLLIRNFVKNKINVIIPYPISQKNYERIMNSLKDLKGDIYFFTLNPPLEIVLESRGERGLDDWERERIKYHYSIGINNPSFGEIIDNSKQVPEETVGEIFIKII